MYNKNRKGKHMKCFYCNNEVRWNNDFDTEDTNPDSEYSILSMYQCDKCDTWYEVYHNKKETNGD